MSGTTHWFFDEYGLDEQKTKQWQAFQRKNTLEPMPLAEVIEALREMCAHGLPVVARWRVIYYGGAAAIGSIIHRTLSGE